MLCSCKDVAAGLGIAQRQQELAKLEAYGTVIDLAHYDGAVEGLRTVAEQLSANPDQARRRLESKVWRQADVRRYRLAMSVLLAYDRVLGEFGGAEPSAAAACRLADTSGIRSCPHDAAGTAAIRNREKAICRQTLGRSIAVRASRLVLCVLALRTDRIGAGAWRACFRRAARRPGGQNR